jgi:nitric oxide reductase subunit C
MLSKSAAKAFFLVGTALCGGAFLLLTVDTLKQVETQTHGDKITAEVELGHELWDKNNCMGCHTLLGEGAYYAPELTKVYERRGPVFIRSMLKDPAAMYPGQRRMQKYDLTDKEIDALVAFFEWIGRIDTNGFPPKPDLVTTQQTVATPATTAANRPPLFGQVCVACHAVGGTGGAIGPALDGVGKRFDAAYLKAWLRDPLAVKADSKMPKLPLTDAEIDALVTYLSTL